MIPGKLDGPREVPGKENGSEEIGFGENISVGPAKNHESASPNLKLGCHSCI